MDRTKRLQNKEALLLVEVASDLAGAVAVAVVFDVNVEKVLFVLAVEGVLHLELLLHLEVDSQRIESMDQQDEEL